MSSEEFESMFGGEGAGDIFELLFGQRGGARAQRRNAPTRGIDVDAETTLTFDEAYHGCTRLIRLDGHTIRVTIKPGIEDGQVLKIAGKGGAGMNRGSSGDLYLTVRVTPHPDFERKGNDLHCDVPVDLYTAMLGGKAQVKTPKGAVKIDIPKGTPNGTVLRLRGLGMPIHGRRNEFGDMFVKMMIQLPQHLSEEELELFRKLAKLRK